MAYEDWVVSFIDLLGFGKWVMGGAAPEEVEKRLDFASYLAGPDPEFEPEVSFRGFSDCVVRARPINDDRYGIVFHELLDLVHVQAELANQGVFIRGALTIGGYADTGKHVFGPALVRAYELESTIAIYPRVIVDPLLLHAMEADERLRTDQPLAYEKESIAKLLARDHDGLWFVDYLRAFETEVDEPHLYPDFLKHHRDAITSEAGRKLDSVGAKYGWLAEYHNRCVSGLVDEYLEQYGLTREELLVSLGDNLNYGFQ